MFFSVYSIVLLILSSDTSSPHISFEIEIPNMLDKSFNNDMSGQHIPLSHLETARSVTFNLSAKSFCVIPFSFLILEINFPIFSFSISSPTI